MTNSCTYCGKPIAENLLHCSDCLRKETIENLQKCRQIFVNYQEKYEIRDRLKKSVSSKNAYYILSIVFFFIGFISGIVRASIHDYTDGYTDYFLILFFYIFISVACAAALCMMIKIRKQSKNRLLNEINLELENNYNAQELPLYLAFEYSDPHIIDVLLDIFRKGRADTLKEAINCMIDDKHTEEMRKDNEAIETLLAFGIFMNTNKK